MKKGEVQLGRETEYIKHDPVGNVTLRLALPSEDPHIALASRQLYRPTKEEGSILSPSLHCIHIYACRASNYQLLWYQYM